MANMITTAQAAKVLGVTPARVRHLVMAGRLPAQHLTARMLLIDSADLAKVRVRKTGRPKKTSKPKPA